jgi:hypothetical protein
LQAEADTDAERAEQQRQVGEVETDGGQADREAECDERVVQDAPEGLHRRRRLAGPMRGHARERGTQDPRQQSGRR